MGCPRIVRDGSDRPSSSHVVVVGLDHPQPVSKRWLMVWFGLLSNLDTADAGALVVARTSAVAANAPATHFAADRVLFMMVPLSMS